MGRSELPKYRKKVERGISYATVRIGGKDHRLGRYDTAASRAEYDRIIGIWLANGRRAIETVGISVAALCSAYLTHAKTYYRKNGKPTDEQACIRAVTKRLLELFPADDANDFGPLKLEILRNLLIDQDNCRGYINKQIGRVRRIWRWGVSRELVAAETYTALMTLEGLKANRTAARETAPIEPVSPAIVDKTLKQIIKPTTADMIKIHRLIGCRPGELVSMKPSEITESETVWVYIPSDHKTNHQSRSRQIVIGPKAHKILTKYLNGQPNQPCFKLNNGKPYQPSHYRHHIRSACIRAKVPIWTPNQLRHSVATSIRSTHGLEAAQVVLGHAKADVTQIYAERDLQKAKQVMEEVG